MGGAGWTHGGWADGGCGTGGASLDGAYASGRWGTWAEGGRMPRQALWISPAAGVVSHQPCAAGGRVVTFLLLPCWHPPCSDVPPLALGTNPASWVLEVTSPEAERDGGHDFPALWAGSQLARDAAAEVEQLRLGCRQGVLAGVLGS